MTYIADQCHTILKMNLNMGCVVYSSAKGDLTKLGLIDPVLDQLFLCASNTVLRDTGNVDKGLRSGQLLSSNSLRMLDRATESDCYEIERWGVDKVKEMSERANWDFRYLTEFTWAYLSAKSFLNICGSSGLSCKFFLTTAIRSIY